MAEEIKEAVAKKPASTKKTAKKAGNKKAAIVNRLQTKYENEVKKA